MNVLITGADGFIGKNLIAALKPCVDIHVLSITRNSSVEDLREKTVAANIVFHLAGANRPASPDGFERDNVGLTRALVEAVLARGAPLTIVYTSSIQAERDNDYGRSKLGAERLLLDLQERRQASVHIYRLPNVFGKWSRPNYNSAIATFCHNAAHGLPLPVNDPGAELRLVYVDDVVEEFVTYLRSERRAQTFPEVSPVFTTTVGEAAQLISSFGESRSSLMSQRVGVGLARALYATYVSFLPTERFSYSVPKYGDQRGVFVEMLKTPDSGQFSFFTAHPGVTRGGHYHHTKTEKFLVLKGVARFRFRHILTDETHELLTTGDEPVVVDTIPGWSHDITNIGDGELIVMLWANENFDRARPDTYAHAV